MIALKIAPQVVTGGGSGFRHFKPFLLSVVHGDLGPGDLLNAFGRSDMIPVAVRKHDEPDTLRINPQPIHRLAKPCRLPGCRHQS